MSAPWKRVVRFYERVLRFQRNDTPGKPTALSFGTCKLNIHEVGHTFEPKARVPTARSGDFCLIATEPIQSVLDRIRSENVPVEAGPVERDGAQGEMMSVYFRDPDHNLVEISRYL